MKKGARYWHKLTVKMYSLWWAGSGLAIKKKILIIFRSGSRCTSVLLPLSIVELKINLIKQLSSN